MGWVNNKGANSAPQFKEGGQVEKTRKEKRELNKEIRAENREKRKERRAEIKDINVKAKDWDMEAIEEKEGPDSASKAKRKRILKKRARAKYRANKIKKV